MTDTVETTENGQAPRPRGRAVPPLPTHTFDTGITVQIRKLSPFLRDDIEAQIRRDDKRDGTLPQPPLAPGVDGKPEPNEADPDYIQARTRYELELQGRLREKLLRVAIKRGVEVDVDVAAVAALRADMAEIGVELDPDDKYVYVTRVCVGSNEDIGDLYTALFTRSTPSQEAIDGHKATFRGDVPGS